MIDVRLQTAAATDDLCIDVKRSRNSTHNTMTERTLTFIGYPKSVREKETNIYA